MSYIRDFTVIALLCRICCCFVGLIKELSKTATGRLNNGVPQIPPGRLPSDLSTFGQTLPVFGFKDSIVKAINENKVVLISGETGSGKTTQVCVCWQHIQVLTHCGPVRQFDENRSGATLVQVMACCLTAPSHYLKQCWLFINGVL